MDAAATCYLASFPVIFTREEGSRFWLEAILAQPCCALFPTDLALLMRTCLIVLFIIRIMEPACVCCTGQGLVDLSSLSLSSPPPPPLSPFVYFIFFFFFSLMVRVESLILMTIDHSVLMECYGLGMVSFSDRRYLG